MTDSAHFVFGPNAVLNIIGLMRGRNRRRATPARDWRTVTVDVLIHAFNEDDDILRCLASITRQTLRARKIIVVDDGSSDLTGSRALRFGCIAGIHVDVVTRLNSIGKTPSIREQARALDSDVLFVLDADTILESDTYIERVVQELYQGVGIASACGSILPLREKDRQAIDESAPVRAFVEASPAYRPPSKTNWLHRLATATTNIYREVLYVFLQRLVFGGQMAAFGTINNPAGCAVAYRRAYLKDLFDRVDPNLPDRLRNSDEVFIGWAMLNEGYRNIQVLDVCARTTEPEVQRLPRQVDSRSSAFLQSTLYFDALLRSCRFLLTSAIEKVVVPTLILIMILLGWWKPLGVIIVVETLLSVTALMFVMKGRRLEFLLKGIAITPIRYALLASELRTIARFAVEVWLLDGRAFRYQECRTIAASSRASTQPHFDDRRDNGGSARLARTVPLVARATTRGSQPAHANPRRRRVPGRP